MGNQKHVFNVCLCAHILPEIKVRKVYRAKISTDNQNPDSDLQEQSLTDWIGPLWENELHEACYIKTDILKSVNVECAACIFFCFGLSFFKITYS